MDIKSIISKVDHTVLAQGAVFSDVKAVCDDALRFGAASVCIAPSFVRPAYEYLGDKMPVCTVIGFPNGYSTRAVKCFETKEAVLSGAGEIDMVINIGDLKSAKYDALLDEINAVKDCCGERILKVIIETCLLEQNEKIKMCEIVSKSEADFIKTSTGFSSGGATESDITLFKKHLSPEKKIKAAGGISSFEDAERFISLGASRLGTSRLIKLLKEKEKESNV